MTSTATTGAQICARYVIEPAVFMTLAIEERALYRADYAADVLHVEEVPRGSNRGPDVDRYLTSVGSEPGEPWCGAFGGCMLLDSGATRSLLPENPASVHGWLEWAETQKRILGRPVRACGGLLIFTPTEGHWCFVSDVVGNQCKTVEGNTNVDGSREGYGVFRKIRPISEFHCFVDLSKLGS